MVTLTQSGKTALDDLVVRRSFFWLDHSPIDKVEKASLTAENTLPGFVLGATNGEEDIYFNSGGYKTLNDPTSGKIDQDAVLWICSMTKLVAHVRIYVDCAYSRKSILILHASDRCSPTVGPRKTRAGNSCFPILSSILQPDHFGWCHVAESYI